MKNLTDLEVVFVHQTEKAVLVKLDEESTEEWIPKRYVEMSDDDPDRGDVIEITLPTSVAQEKGLI